MSQPEIHRANPAYRRRMLVLTAVIAVAALLALWGLHSWLRSLSLAQPGLLMIWLPRLLFGVAVIIATGAFLGGRYLRDLAVRVESGKRWPPQDMQTSSDIKVLYLSAAVSQARQFRWTAYALWGLAAVVLGWGLMVLLA